MSFPGILTHQNLKTVGSLLFSAFSLTPMTVPANPQPAAGLNPKSGFIEHRLITDYQEGPTLIEILLPDPLEPSRKYPVLYILPVEAGHRSEFGHGLVEARKADIANKFGVICVYPSFNKAAPWYGNHATDPTLRQEDYIVKALIPFIDKNYPTQENKEGRWLLGFSKSAWGAYTLLLRHQDVFGYAAGWDAPFMLDGDSNKKDWGPMGLSKNFGTSEAMRQSLPSRLVVEKAAWLKERPRLVLGLGIFWAAQTKEMEALLQQNGIPHVYRKDLTVPHRWDSGWLPVMAEELAKSAQAPK